VRVIFTHDIADDARRLLVGLVVVVIDFVHRKENAPVDGLEAVAHVGYGAPDYDAHSVVEIGKLYFVGNVYGPEIHTLIPQLLKIIQELRDSSIPRSLNPSIPQFLNS